MKATGITSAICLLIAFLFTVGDPDIVDVIQIRIMAVDAVFCKKMRSPLGGVVAGTEP